MPAFQTIYPAHSIEQCSLSLVFNQALPQKVLERTLASLKPALRNAGLEATQAQGVGFQVDSQGKLTPVSAQGPSQFVSPDQGTSLMLLPNMILMQTARYVRWTPFLGQVEDLVLPAAQQYCDSLELLSVQLEYLDTFLWDGSWDDFNWRDLLRADSGFLTATASQAAKQWHSNSGWFDFVGAGLRRLKKVDISVVERAVASGGTQPAVNILSTHKDEGFAALGEPVTSYIEAANLMQTLDSLHGGLKDMLKEIITDQMASRIGLRGSQNAS